MYEKTVLSNGLRVFSSAMPHTRSVSVCIFVGVGGRYESDAEAGISHFIEHMLFKGTARRPASRNISEAIEGVGGVINAGTDKELTIYWCKVARHHFLLSLDVLTDIILNSKFNREEMEKERRVIIEEINLTRDFPAQRVEMLIDELLWPGHPLGREIAGTKESVNLITRDIMLDYMANQYMPSNTVVSVAGDIQHPEAVEAVGLAMSGWSNKDQRPPFQAFQGQAGPRIRIETRETEQTQICLGLPGLSLLDPKRFALDMLNVILGEGMSSRLFTEVRDKLGLVYNIASFTDHFQDSGSITICAGVDASNLRVAITAILEQLASLRDNIPEAELYKAKESSKGRLLLRMEDSRSVAGWLGGQEILTGRVFTVDDIIDIIEKTNVDDLKQAARELIIGDRLKLAVVGPIPAEEPLEGLLRI